MLGVQTPNEADPTGEQYAFEKGATKADGGDGFADVWKRDHFAWEYKGKRKDLAAAYQQLLQYREALENPPLLVVCDLNRFEVHTNFTGTLKQVHKFSLTDLAKDPRAYLRVLRAALTDPAALRPAHTRAELTEEAAAQFAAIAKQLRDRKHDSQAVAHFLTKLVFCMFAEDSGLLPTGLLRRLADSTRLEPATFAAGLADLFEKMSKSGGLFGVDRIQWFNGGLFDGPEVLQLTTDEIDTVRKVSELDWSEIEPAIFGTLFERGLDESKRSLLGAHYTDRASILRLVEPVLIAPLRREFDHVRAQVEAILPASRNGAPSKAQTKQASKLVQAFLDRIGTVTVLDPACGSGNFLYIALQCLKDFERSVIDWGAAALRTSRPFPNVGPHQLHGIEVNVYAVEVARVTIWIGEIQWMIANGFAYHRDPILKALDNIQCRDAVLDLSDPAHPCEPQWPKVDAIVGNPPFLGGKLLRSALGDTYVDALFRVYADRVPAEADLVTYWFEKARGALEKGRAKRVGLLATQGIRGGANRLVLERIKNTGDIFLAWSDEPWVLDGANVHVSFVGFDRGEESVRELDGLHVAEIHSDLTSGADLTRARRLKENLGIAFMGDTKGGAFDIPAESAKAMLDAPNPHGRSNRDVVRPWVNGKDLTQRPRGMWIIDFGVDMPEVDAAMYSLPFEYLKARVRPIRLKSRSTISSWWLHERPRVDMRNAMKGLSRYIATPRVAKHRVFAWLPAATLPDCALIAFARDDDYTFGVLHSRAHEIWALHQGTQLETRPRYTPTTTFETFPFPEPSAKQREVIAAAAKQLDAQRETVLNGRGSKGSKPPSLTQLYNERPTWLLNAHVKLDHAVLDAYGWPHDIDDESLRAKLLDLNLTREHVERSYSAQRTLDDPESEE